MLLPLSLSLQSIISQYIFSAINEAVMLPRNPRNYLYLFFLETIFTRIAFGVCRPLEYWGQIWDRFFSVIISPFTFSEGQKNIKDICRYINNKDNDRGLCVCVCVFCWLFFYNDEDKYNQVRLIQITFSFCCRDKDQFYITVK